MSARRLAIRQPESFELSAAAKKEIATWVKKYPKDRARSALIPALWIAQKDAGGWLPEPALRLLGDMLDMAYIRVYEVATFYTMFNLEPVGTHYVQLCGTTPCWLRGSDDLIAMLKRKIGPQRSISADGKLSWLEVECLGSCANAPMVQISNAEGDSYYEDLTAESLEAVLDDLVAGKTPKAGSQSGRHTSEPAGGALSLTAKNFTEKCTKLPNQDKKVIYTDGPTDGPPDDLKKIKGIGPKFEGDLNGKGIYYFRQIGAWKAADVKMVEDLIDSIPGRIKRDEWVKQGKALAKGGKPRAMKGKPAAKKGKA